MGRKSYSSSVVCACEHGKSNHVANEPHLVSESLWGGRVLRVARAHSN